jgi:copper chaperone
MENITIKVGGMTCQGCVASLKRALNALDGVGAVDVSLERGEAKVEYQPGRVNSSTLRSTIEDAGYEVVG